MAQERQVIFLTRDNRLPQAVRRLGIDATILEVQRSGRCYIVSWPAPQARRPSTLTACGKAPVLDPVERPLEEDRALVRTLDFVSAFGGCGLVIPWTLTYIECCG